MKKTSKIILILLLALLVIAAMTVAACTPNDPQGGTGGSDTPDGDGQGGGGNQGDDPTHQHTFSQQWSISDAEHWHAATCNHDVTADRAAHDYGADNVCDTCGYTEAQGGNQGDDPTHQHTFTEQWSVSDAEHWHAAVCNHDVTADNAAHTLVNNVCSVCGYKNKINWDDFTFEPDGDGYVLTKYNGAAAHVNIPDIYNDLPVISIGEDAFSECKSLRSVTIPDSVIIIDGNRDRNKGAFFACINLTTVNFGENSQLDSIGDCAFLDCISLKLITIPDSVTSIGQETFTNCGLLTSIIIPNCVSIGFNAFGGCFNLTTVNFGTNSKLESIDMFAFAGCSNLTSITIPDSVTSIGDSAFGGCSLTSITIPDSVTSIGKGAFAYCHSLTSIIIPNGVTSIGNCAFEDCYSLVIYCEAPWCPDGWDLNWNGDIWSIPVVWNCSQNNIAEDGYLYDIVDGIRYGFKGNEAKVSGNNYTGDITISSTVNYQGKDYKATSIGWGAFGGCSNLTSITIPDSVTSIGDSAFRGCSLTSITIPDSVTSIGKLAFADCENLVSVNIGQNSKLESIGMFAFASCSNLTSITIPDSVTSIGESAFAYCHSLTSIFIPRNVKNMGNSIFSSCEQLTVYCEVAARPSGWNWGWHGGKVVWGATREDA